MTQHSHNATNESVGLYISTVVFFFFLIFIAFFLAGMGARCWSSSCPVVMSQGYSLAMVRALVLLVPSLVTQHILWGGRASVAAVPGLWSTDSVAVGLGLTFSVTCGIFPDQGPNSCLLHWQAESLPLGY